MFSVDIRFDEINNMDNFIAGGKAASLENEIKNYKTDFIYKDRDFGLGYNMGKRQNYLQKTRVSHKGRSMRKTKKCKQI